MSAATPQWRHCNQHTAFTIPSNGDRNHAAPIHEWRCGQCLIPFEFETSNGEPLTTLTTLLSNTTDTVTWKHRLTHEGKLLCESTLHWQTGGDTITVDDVIHEQGPTLRWHPLGQAKATAYIGGGGERTAPMGKLQPLRHDPNAADQCLAALGHISYFNQWQHAWAVLCSDESPNSPAIGIFTGWGSKWRGRGTNRIELRRDGGSDYVLLPMTPGRRRWGIVLGTRKSLAVDCSKTRSTPNRRKSAFADLPTQKTSTWQLDLPVPERKSNLIGDIDLPAVCEKLRKDERFTIAMNRYRDVAQPRDPFYAAWAFLQQDESAINRAIDDICQWATDADREIIDGGYERLIIFDGRQCKRRAYDLDVYWAHSLISEADYKHVRRFMLKLAYMFADGDFVRYEDFWLSRVDPDDAALAERMGKEMGPCPVPPNFAAEFFSTVGVVAELFPDHPKSAEWRAWTIHQLDQFLDHFFEDDGTYRESINYHNHTLNMLLCLLWPLDKRGRSYFSDSRIRGSFEHFLHVAVPATSQQESPIPPRDGEAWPAARHVLLSDTREPRRAYINNGNSGNDWCMQPARGELLIGATAYRSTDPELAANLASLWEQVGRPVLDGEHPMLTLATLLPEIAPVAANLHSVHRKSLGVISRTPTDKNTFAFFRAGSATNHMDFDQGHVSLIQHGKVLLHDPGYHGHLPDGKSIPAAATCWHNTVVYSHDLANSSGYKGLEKAPEPQHVHISEEFDWCVHTIVTTNFRRLGELDYRVGVPCETVTHTRRYLFHKPTSCIILEDFIEPVAKACSYLLYPPARMVQNAAGRFTCDCGDDVQLSVAFVTSIDSSKVQQVDLGACWQFVYQMRQPRLLAVISTDHADDPVEVACIDESTIHLALGSNRWQIRLPAPIASDQLPEISDC